MRIRGKNRDLRARSLATEESVSFDVWKASKPRPPDTDRPLYTRPDDSLAVGLTLLLAFLGAILSYGTCAFAGAIQNMGVMVNGLFCAVAIPMVILLIGFTFRSLNHAVSESQHVRLLAKLGWTKYDEELERWEQSRPTQ